MMDTIDIFWSDEDQGYIALAIHLPGCSAFGDTREEAVAELVDAMTAWRQAAQAAGNDAQAQARR